MILENKFLRFPLLSALALLPLDVIHCSEPPTDTSVLPQNASTRTPNTDLGYRIYPGDDMKVEVFDHPELTIQLHIPPNGHITFPLIGDVDHLVGRTVENLTEELKKRLEDGYVPTAVVTVSFSAFGPRTAYVMGCVHTPTSIDLTPFATTTAMQAISRAGGFAEGANRAASHIIREDEQHTSKLAIPLPIGDDTQSMRKDVPLEPGDIVIVPRLDRVFILGQVDKPGALDLPGTEDLTVSKAISIAGGFKRFGRQSEVQLIRNGVTIKVVDVKAILAGAHANDPKLLPGDTIFVPETRF